MADVEKRRKAGAAGAGDSQPDEGTKPDEKPGQKRDVKKVLAPAVLEFSVKRDGKTLQMHVPTEFTLGELVRDDVQQDFDAYVRLVMVELGNVSSIDVKVNPQLMFTRENMRYLDVVLGASNVRTFMGRVLSKTAYLIDPDDADKAHLAVRAGDLSAISYDQALTIGASYVNRWLDRWIEARRAEKAAADAKNAGGAAQT